MWVRRVVKTGTEIIWDDFILFYFLFILIIALNLVNGYDSRKKLGECSLLTNTTKNKELTIIHERFR